MKKRFFKGEDMHIMRLILIVGVFFLHSAIYAQVEKVTITWRGILCEKICMSQLEGQFRRIPGVENVTMYTGQADLKWRANFPFAFSPINTAMELLGITINDIRVTVRGTLQHRNDQVTLISSGDYTRFELLNPVKPQYGQAPQYNTAARSITRPLLQELIDGEVQGKIAIIDGPLLFPERSPPLTLVVDRLTFSNPPPKK